MTPPNGEQSKQSTTEAWLDYRRAGAEIFCGHYKELWELEETGAHACNYLVNISGICMVAGYGSWAPFKALAFMTEVSALRELLV